jgi:aspartyl-tRNA(Asn)/glutamyl-tRNA(Gln) amidotransferase subunit A
MPDASGDMRVDGLWRLSVTDSAAAYHAGHILPSDMLGAILGRLEQVNPVLNCIAAIDAEGAHAAAAASDARWQAGAPLSALDGVVLTIKDNITVAGMPCTWGSHVFEGFMPEADETPVALLRAAGAVILGKTTCSEFTVAQTNVNTRLFGATRNPWDPRLTTGASSGGAVAAVASGIGAAALGTDGGGSIRRPASHCGLVGLKPSTGMVGRRRGLPVILHDCEVIGPIARRVRDAAAIFDCIAEPHPEDRASLAFDRSALRAGASADPKRILYVGRFPHLGVDEEVEAACAAAADRLAAIGHPVERGEIPFDIALYDKYWATITQAGVAWLLRGRDWQGHISDLHTAMQRAGAEISAMQYIEALTSFRELQAQVGRFFASYDLLMTPTAGALPWPVEQEGPPHARAFSGFVNAVGAPAINIPAEPTDAGIPVGFQLIGPWGADWMLLAVAEAYERHFPWHHRWPAI